MYKLYDFASISAASLLGLALALLGQTAPARAQTAQPTMFQQAPCPLTGGICASLCPNGFCTVPPSGPYLSLVRSYYVLLPARGRAQINFDGSMQCSNSSTRADLAHGVVDLSAQIVTSPGETPSYTGPSGLRLNFRFPPRVTGSPDVSQTLNLHTSRVVNYTTGGWKGVHYKFLVHRADETVACAILSGAFSVVYLPY